MAAFLSITLCNFVYDSVTQLMQSRKGQYDRTVPMAYLEKWLILRIAESIAVVQAQFFVESLGEMLDWAALVEMGRVHFLVERMADCQVASLAGCSV
jgi:hypothetical protein